MLISQIFLELCPGQKSKGKNKKGQLLQNKAGQGYGSLALHF
jgi:hypothetical protein